MTLCIFYIFSSAANVLLPPSGLKIDGTCLPSHKEYCHLNKRSSCNLNLLHFEGSIASHNCSSFESMSLSDVFQLALSQIKL